MSEKTLSWGKRKLETVWPKKPTQTHTDLPRLIIHSQHSFSWTRDDAEKT